MSTGIPPLSFKVPLVGCRFYAVLGILLLVAVLGAFGASYVRYPAAREFLAQAFVRHYVPMGALAAAGAFVVWRLWARLDR